MIEKKKCMTWCRACDNISLRNFIYDVLKRLRNENPSNTILSFLNVNSICYKFEDLKFFCMDNVEILFRERKN